MDQRFAEACIQAQNCLMAAARRLSAANDELHAAEVAHRVASEGLDEAERLYYRLPAHNTGAGT